MDLIEWMSHKKNFEAYLKWKNDPITQAIHSGLKDLSVPKRLADPTGEAALQENGFNAGQNSILSAMMNLEVVSIAGPAAEDLAENKKRYLIEFEGYTEVDADRIIGKMEAMDHD